MTAIEADGTFPLWRVVRFILVTIVIPLVTLFAFGFVAIVLAILALAVTHSHGVPRPVLTAPPIMTGGFFAVLVILVVEAALAAFIVFRFRPVSGVSLRSLFALNISRGDWMAMVAAVLFLTVLDFALSPAIGNSNRALLALLRPGLRVVGWSGFILLGIYLFELLFGSLFVIILYDGLLLNALLRRMSLWPALLTLAAAQSIFILLGLPIALQMHRGMLWVLLLLTTFLGAGIMAGLYFYTRNLFAPFVVCASRFILSLLVFARWT